MLQWLRRMVSNEIKKENPAARSVVVYSRVGCHLCDEACEILKQHGLKPEVVDIDADPNLREQYTECVPVVLIDGRERFRGRVNEFLLRRLLRS
jgi:glutaredoxin